MPPHLKTLILCLSLLLPNAIFAQSKLWSVHETDTVEWQRWSAKTIDEAQSADKPLFFFVAHYGNSLARSMLNETFQNKTIAATLNESTIPVLVDINEEPELASLLSLLAFQHFSADGLPTCLWTDTKLAPLNGGGYFPPTDDWGGQGFLSLARNVSEQWNSNRADYLVPANERLEKSLAKTKQSLSQLSERQGVFDANTFAEREAPTLLALDLYNAANYAASLPLEETEALRTAMSEHLTRITSGAGFDSIDGGFFIGSNDPNWRLPLFQKSTIDQAYMLLALSELHQLDPNPEYMDLIKRTAEFVERDLLMANGLARQFSDSFAPGETPDMIEGSYYLIAGSDVSTIDPVLIEAWGLSENGNLDENTDILGIYTAQNVPFAKSNEVLSDKFEQERQTLRSLRNKKTKPSSEDIGYTATNALLVRALANASAATKNAHYQTIAAKLLQSTLASNFDSASHTLFNSDQRTLKASSQDYAQLIAAASVLAAKDDSANFLDTAKTIADSWKTDDRFNSQNPLERNLNLPEIRTTIYSDNILESPLALYLVSLDLKSEEASKTVAIILDSLPSLAISNPELYHSLYAFAKRSAQAN